MAGILCQSARLRKEGLAIDPQRVPPPHSWLIPAAAWLDAQLQGARIEGVMSGRGWVSLRVDGEFLWLLAQPGLRAAWLATRGIPQSYAEALGRHQRSPFAPLLQDQSVVRVEALADEGGEPAALRLELSGARRLGIRFWPRPGAVWVEDAQGKAQSVSPPDAPLVGEGLVPIATVSPGDDAWTSPEAEAHAERCLAALVSRLENATLRRLRDTARARRRKCDRLAEALERESRDAEEQSGLRAHADLLASQLYRVRAGQTELELDDFEGATVRIALDPSLSPAQNLDRIYRRAGRAERKREQLESRREALAVEQEAARQTQAAVEEVRGLDSALELAKRLGVELRPRAPGEHRGRARPSAPRLPYRVFVLSTGREVWVGRGAKDNDALTFRHAAPRDLWFHAGGVEGSHVVLRHLGAEPSPAELEAAARLAALHSKAKGATTVPVWVTERRHVRKPRKAPPGTVAPERMRTLFVEPGEPPGSWRRREE